MYDLSGLTDEQHRAFERAERVMAEHGSSLMSRPNVVGVGVGFATRAGFPTDQIALVVMVESKFEAQALPPGALLPRQIDGVRVDVQETGNFSAGITADTGFSAGGAVADSPPVAGPTSETDNRGGRGDF